MYTKEQASQIRQAFWTAFGQYMALHPSVEGYKVNWINYKTGLKHVYFRMNAEKNAASIAIEIIHPDIEIQQLFYEQFLTLKLMLEDYQQETWEWVLHTSDNNGKTISRICKELPNVNVFRQDDWPAIISFLKPRIIALDAFWGDAQFSFESLK